MVLALFVWSPLKTMKSQVLTRSGFKSTLLFLCGLLFKLCRLKIANRFWSIQLGLSEVRFTQVVRLVKALPSLVSTRLRQAFLRFNTVWFEVMKLRTFCVVPSRKLSLERFDWVSVNFCLSFLCGLADQKRQLLWYCTLTVRAILLMVAFSFWKKNYLKQK